MNTHIIVKIMIVPEITRGLVIEINSSTFHFSILSISSTEGMVELSKFVVNSDRPCSCIPKSSSLNMTLDLLG